MERMKTLRTFALLLFLLYFCPRDPNGLPELRASRLLKSTPHLGAFASQGLNWHLGPMPFCLLILDSIHHCFFDLLTLHEM